MTRQSVKSETGCRGAQPARREGSTPPTLATAPSRYSHCPRSRCLRGRTACRTATTRVRGQVGRLSRDRRDGGRGSGPQPPRVLRAFAISRMAGYSGTPLPQKLGIKPQFRVAFVELPSEVKSELKDSLKSCEVLSDGRSPLDFAMLFVKSRSELKNQFGRIARQLAPAGIRLRMAATECVLSARQGAGEPLGRGVCVRASTGDGSRDGA